MYLKRLELYGFKTFADRTELEFGPGITAIVGPNGSGKSNISDAILWVLGEQAMRSIRSAGAVDVIFKGSEARKALGMAEVNLTLDNASGVLPTEFTEVTVSRRIFRSGESEYLLNRIPVRLRDVQDLFVDTGIGKQSYSLISQGEVDAILSSRAEDRRALFEEVAGINKYKLRKKEALRKLDQTRLNLIRVSDIIGELEEQLGPLAEQSEKARQYQLLHAELTDLRLSLLVMQYQGLQGSLGRSREREDELRRELESLRHERGALEIRETTLRAELQAAEDGLEGRREVEARVASAIQAVEGKLELLKQQEETARREGGRLEREREDWGGQAAQFEAEIAAAQAEQARLRDAMAGLEAEVADADAALREADAALHDMARQVEERRGAYLDLLDQAARARNELARVESLLRTSQGRLDRIEAERAEIAEKMAERQQAHAAALAQADEQRKAREGLAARRVEADRRRQGAVEREAAFRREEAAAREELAGLRARQRTLRELEETREGYFPGVRAVMAAAGAGELRGQFAPVSEILTVPAELETAVEVALGSGLQDVVADSETSARQAVALLKSSRAGRATFLPLDLITPAPRASLSGAAGIIGLAIDLVRYEAKYEKVAQHHLGRVVIARDLDAALALAASTAARGWSRIVTLEGEVVHPHRAITGGSLGKGSGLLTRKRELQEITPRIGEREQGADELGRRAGEAAASVRQLEAELASLARADEEVATATAAAERDAATVQRDIHALEERASALREEAAWVAGEVEASRADEAGRQQALTGLEIAQREAEDAITAAERSLAGGRGERDALTERYSTLRLRHTEAQGQLRAQEAAAERAAQLRDALRQRLAQNSTAGEVLAAQLARAKDQQRRAAEELAQLRVAYARGAEEVAAARDRRAALLDAIAASLEAQKAGREAVEDCQDRLHRTALRTAQVEAEIGFLDGQLFEDYRLTPDQAAARAAPVEARAAAAARLKELAAVIAELGVVNLGAIEEHERIGERLRFLTVQREDLERSREDLARVIAEIDATCREKFREAFRAVSREFQDLFARLFGGGATELTLADPSDVLESGIEIHVTIPGRRNQHLLQLSGGERALTALALLFAVLRIKPCPFVVLDEIDAPLDEANIGRYCDVLRDFTANTQFLIITHNKGTMEVADVLYGVTMEKAGVSKTVSVRLADAQRQEEALSAPQSSS